MSYQVLARKWRPRSFQTLVGQEHVVRALSHALAHKRLHHAYLFTGTRGVGKTTLSRILAKALNCVGQDGQGDITAEPCGACPACTAIDAGRFVDYIEMDAASNRGVDEMAQLLEQAVYAPSNARFKVYMIDEVHMLSNHAFNAMLKTLEEPPDYVKFILATTDPQKIPVTVLSRCLQFNLKQMPAAQIVPHLAQILEAESIPFQKPALALLARAASGSMRDALSLTDQAIAYGASEVTEAAVRGMLGALDQTYLVRILDALVQGDGVGLLGVADEIAERSLSYGGALQDLASLLHRMAVLQCVPNAPTADWENAVDAQRLAGLMSPEGVQLNYDIVSRGRHELGLAPDEYAGFTMTLMRMLAFRPAPSEGETIAAGESTAPAGRSSVAALRMRAQARQSTGAAVREERSPQATGGGMSLPPEGGNPALVPMPKRGHAASPQPASTRAPEQEQARVDRQGGRAPEVDDAAAPRALPILSGAPSVVGRAVFDGDWIALTRRIRISGMARQLLEQAELLRYEGTSFHIRVPIKSLLEGTALDKLRAALQQELGPEARLTAEVGAVQGRTVAAEERSARATRQAEAVQAIEADPFVRALVKDFGATIVPGSIKPAPHPDAAHGPSQTPGERR